MKKVKNKKGVDVWVKNETNREDTRMCSDCKHNNPSSASKHCQILRTSELIAKVRNVDNVIWECEKYEPKHG